MPSCLVIDSGNSNKKLKILYDLGFCLVDTRSWRNISAHMPELNDLLVASSAWNPTRSDPANFLVPEVETDLIRTELGSDLVQHYFFELTKNYLMKISGDKAKPAEYLIAFNFMPFMCRLTDAISIVSGVCEAISSFPHIKYLGLVFFVRTNGEFVKGLKRSNFLLEKPNPKKVVIIDYDAFVKVYESDTFSSGERYIETPKTLQRLLFKNLVRRDEKQFYHELIFDTNMNIGHFALSNSHIRTHYNLSEFVERDNIYEHLYGAFCRITEQYRNICIITTGLERIALNAICMKFMTSNTQDIHSSNSDSSNRRLTHIGHYFSEDIPAHRIEFIEMLRDYDCILILTDIVNSGKTVTDLYDSVSQIANGLADVEKDIYIKPEIKIYAIAKMINTPGKNIESSLVILRPYYRPEPDKCPLCILGQPLKVINPLNWDKDFRYVDSAQLTPLDFWEMVEDCHAMNIRERYAGGSTLLHRVNNKRLISRYRHWLGNIIKEKYNSRWSQKPNLIVTVCDLEEEVGREFAILVKQALEIEQREILEIPRLVLDGRQSASGDIIDKLREQEDQGGKILIVDDGINRGGTVRKLNRFINKYAIKVIGIFVLDSRIEEADLQKYKDIGKTDVQALYTWPSKAAKSM